MLSTKTLKDLSGFLTLLEKLRIVMLKCFSKQKTNPIYTGGKQLKTLRFPQLPLYHNFHEIRKCSSWMLGQQAEAHSKEVVPIFSQPPLPSKSRLKNSFTKSDFPKYQDKIRTENLLINKIFLLKRYFSEIKLNLVKERKNKIFIN